MNRWFLVGFCLMIAGSPGGRAETASDENSSPQRPRYKLWLCEGQSETGVLHGPGDIHLERLDGPLEPRHKEAFVRFSVEKTLKADPNKAAALKLPKPLTMAELEKRREGCEALYRNLLAQALAQGKKEEKSSAQLLRGQYEPKVTALDTWSSAAVECLITGNPSSLSAIIRDLVAKWENLPPKKSIPLPVGEEDLIQGFTTLGEELDQLAEWLPLLMGFETEWTDLLDKERAHLLAGRAVWGPVVDIKSREIKDTLLGFIIPVPHGDTDIEIKILWGNSVDETQFSVAWLASLGDIFRLETREACTTMWSEGDTHQVSYLFALWKKIGFHNATSSLAKGSKMRFVIDNFWLHLAGAWAKLNRPSIVEGNPDVGQLDPATIATSPFLEAMSQQAGEFSLKSTAGQGVTLQELYRRALERIKPRATSTD